MEAIHTKGPWTLETVKTTCGICHRIGPFPWRDNQANHACVYVDNAYIGDEAHNPLAAELLANARLIAAAPDMLAALLAIDLARHTDAEADWEKATRLSDAAISKATSRQPEGER